MSAAPASPRHVGYCFHQSMPYHVAISPTGYACLAQDPQIEFLRPI